MVNFAQWLEQSWAVMVAIIAGVTLVWNFFNKTVKEIKADIQKPFNDINTRFDAVEQKIDERHADDVLVRNALMTMQRQLILDACNKCLKDGYADLHQKEVIIAQFESYKALGGNSFVHQLVEEVKDLPVEK